MDGEKSALRDTVPVAVCEREISSFILNTVIRKCVP